MIARENSSRLRAVSLTVAFGVVAGGVALVAPMTAPAAFAAPTDPVVAPAAATPAVSVVSTDLTVGAINANGIEVRVTGLQPGQTFDMVAYSQADGSMIAPRAGVNKPFTAEADGTWQGAVVFDTTWVAGDYSIAVGGTGATVTAPFTLVDVAVEPSMHLTNDGGDGQYTVAEADANGVAWEAVGLTPAAEVTVSMVLPDGSVEVLDDVQYIVEPNGGVAGTVTITGGSWDTGKYVITAVEGQTELQVGFEVVAEAKTVEPGGALTNDEGEDGIYTVAQADEKGIAWGAWGLTPDSPAKVVLRLPDGTEEVLDDTEYITDADGNVAGEVWLENASWDEGDYVILVTVDGKTVEIPFTVSNGEAKTDEGEQGGEAQRLAATGADAFGPAGLALMTLIAGAGAVAASRRFAK